LAVHPHAPTAARYTAAEATTQDPVISWLAVARTGDTTTAPDAPANVTATAGDTTAHVKWSAPASDGGTPITGYTVTAEPGDATCTTTGATECTVTGLTNGTAYTFRVVAHNELAGSPASAPSAAVTPVWLPEAVVIAGPAQVTIGQAAALVATVDPAPANQAVTWQSSNPAVASVMDHCVRQRKAPDSIRSAPCTRERHRTYERLHFRRVHNAGSALQRCLRA